MPQCPPPHPPADAGCMKLVEIVENLESFDRDATIYSAQPWTQGSDSIVAPEPPAGGPPPDAAAGRLAYFLEVAIAKEFIADWTATLSPEPTASEVCDRVIQYAIHDA
jgi:hypothetical protein